MRNQTLYGLLKELEESNCQELPFLTHRKLKIKGVTFPVQPHSCKKHTANQEGALLAYQLRYLFSQNDSAYYFQFFLKYLSYILQ